MWNVSTLAVRSSLAFLLAAPAVSAQATTPPTPAATVVANGTLQLPLIAAPVRDAFFAAIDARHNWSAFVAETLLTRALKLDSTFGLARIFRAGVTGGTTAAINEEYRRGLADAAATNVPQQTLALGHRATGVYASRLLAVAVAMYPNDRHIALDYAFSFTGRAQTDSLRALATRFPDFAAPRMQLAADLAGGFFLDPARPAAQEALTIAQEAVRLAPNVAGSHAALGHVLHRIGRFDEALQHLGAAKRLDRSMEWIYDLEAEIAMHDGKTPNPVTRARALLDSASRFTPNGVRRQNYRRDAAGLLVHDGKISEMAAETITIAREAEVAGALAYAGGTLWRGAIFAAAARDAATADKLIAEARRTPPAPIDLATWEVLTYSLLKRGPEARRALERYIPLVVNPATAANTRSIAWHTAMVLLAEGKYAEAIAEAKKVPDSGGYVWRDLVLMEATAEMGNRTEAAAMRTAYLARKNTPNESMMLATVKYRSMHPQ